MEKLTKLYVKLRKTDGKRENTLTENHIK